MRCADWTRPALFVLLCAALCLSAFAFAEGPGPAQVEPGPAAAAALARPPALTERALKEARVLAAQLRRAARRFLPAFLHYEVGEGGPGVAATLRATATQRFAARLLAAAPRAPGGPSPPARLGALRLRFLGSGQALVTGAARRAARREQLSFLFRRRRGAWLASGPGQ